MKRALILCLFTIPNIMFAPAGSDLVFPSNNGNRQDPVDYVLGRIPLLHNLLESNGYSQMRNRQKFYLSNVECKILYGENFVKPSEIEQTHRSLESFLSFKYENGKNPFYRIYAVRTTNETLAMQNGVQYIDPKRYYVSAAKKLSFLPRFYFSYVRPHIPYKIMR